jgi:hypothetical protein
MTARDQAEKLFCTAFSTPRTPRSEAYKTGVRAAFFRHAYCTPSQCPYDVGTAEADAWFSGLEEGHRLWRKRGEIDGGKS